MLTRITLTQKNVTKIEGINAGLNNKGTSKTQNSSYALARFVVRGAEVSGLTGKSNVVSLPGGTADNDWPCAIVRLIKGQYKDSLNIDSGACGKNCSKHRQSIKHWSDSSGYKSDR